MECKGDSPMKRVFVGILVTFAFCNCFAARGYWLPPNIPQVNGAIMEFNGSSCLGSAAWKEFARQKGFILIGGGNPLIAPTTFFDNQTYDSVDIVLQQIARETNHPEIVNVPFCTFGGSRGGWWALNVADRYPQRTIATVGGYCGMWRYNSGVPVIFPINEFDVTFYLNKTLLQDVDSGFAPNRANGALWSIAAIFGSKDHAVKNMDDLSIAYFDRMIKARLRSGQSTLNGVVKVDSLTDDEGWLSIFLQSRTNYPDLFTKATLYTGIPKKMTCWFVDEYSAWVWRSFVSVNPIVTLTSPAYHSVTSKSVTISATPLYDSISVTKVQFYDGNIVLSDEITSPPFTKTICLSPGVHSISALAYDSAGKKTFSKPATIIVRQDSINCPVKVLPLKRNSKVTKSSPGKFSLLGRNKSSTEKKDKVREITISY